MADNLDWRTRLAVSYTENGKTVDITPIDSFSPSFALSVEPIHSIERTHVGAVFSPQSITFSLTVKAIGDVAARLTALAMQGKRFDITLQEKDRRRLVVQIGGAARLHHHQRDADVGIADRRADRHLLGLQHARRHRGQGQASRWRSREGSSSMATEPGDGEETGAKRVLETGIALVHEGELVLPAAGSEAQAELVADDARAVIHYHFPVEIEVRGGRANDGRTNRAPRLSSGCRGGCGRRECRSS